MAKSKQENINIITQTPIIISIIFSIFLNLVFIHIFLHERKERSMNTKYNSVYEKILYNRITNLIPFKPLLIWANANQQLNNKYKSPDINLTDSAHDLTIKNVMRHTTGLGLAASQYGILAYPIGAIKELFDLLKDLLFHKPIGVISPEVWKDTITDFKNNHEGIQYMLKNPDATIDDLMNFAYSLAKERQYIENRNEKTNKVNKKFNNSRILKSVEIFTNIPLSTKNKSVENITDNKENTYLQGYIEINVNKDETTNSEQGFSTGLAADLFSEEEIEDLKKRMEHERLPKETLKKMGEYHKRKFNEKYMLAKNTFNPELIMSMYIKILPHTYHKLRRQK